MAPLTGQLGDMLTLFFSLITEAMPFLLLGVLFSSLLLTVVDEARLVAVMPRHPLLGAIAGSLFGCLFPVCECGNVPVARRLLVKGVSPAVAIGFLLAAPTVNPIVIWATWIAFRNQPEIVLLRVVITLVIAVSIAWIFSVQKDLRPFLQPAVARAVQFTGAAAARRGGGAPRHGLLQSGTYFLGQPLLAMETGSLETAGFGGASTWTSRRAMMLENIVSELRDLGGLLILGSALASFVQVAVPRESIIGMGQGPISSILAMMLLAGVVSICSTVDSFFALSFAALFTEGSILAFLVFGPMIDIKNIGLLLSVFRSRVIFYLFALAAQMTFLAALLINFYRG
ncbi:MAG: permease [Cyanobacteria bacterium P01_A01_bin.135]